MVQTFRSNVPTIMLFSLLIWMVAAYPHNSCKSEKLHELILETVGIYPHQYSYQAKYMKKQAEDRFGHWWSAVIISERGGYGMSAVYDHFHNTRTNFIDNDSSYQQNCTMETKPYFLNKYAV